PIQNDAPVALGIIAESHRCLLEHCEVFDCMVSVWANEKAPWCFAHRGAFLAGLPTLHEQGTTGMLKATSSVVNTTFADGKVSGKKDGGGCFASASLHSRSKRG